jgi:hypothetical protein
MLVLKPFPSDRSVPPIEISASVNRDRHILSIEYQLHGDLNTLIIPAQTTTPTRKSLLWENTCFEFFVGVPGSPDYWEFNLSPAGDWNIFHLDNYRQGLREELAFRSLGFDVSMEQNLLLLKLLVNLEGIIPAQQDLEISVATVIESQLGEISYWAITHSGDTADFHLRDSFTLKISASIFGDGD